jgi:hypothetical protein
LLPGGSSKNFKKERPFKVALGRGNHLWEIKIGFKCDVDGLPTLPSEIAAPKKMVPGFYYTGITQAAEAVVVECKVVS